MKIEIDKTSKIALLAIIGINFLLISVEVLIIYGLVNQALNGKSMVTYLPIIIFVLVLPYPIYKFFIKIHKGIKLIKKEKEVMQHIQSGFLPNLIKLLSVEFSSMELRRDKSGGVEAIGLDWDMKPHSVHTAKILQLEKEVKENISEISDVIENPGERFFIVKYNNGEEKKIKLHPSYDPSFYAIYK